MHFYKLIKKILRKISLQVVVKQRQKGDKSVAGIEREGDERVLTAKQPNATQ